MAFTSYITFEEYEHLGGTVSKDAFPIIERKAQRWLDEFTFNRIPLLPEVPDEVKEVLCEFINNMDDFDKQKKDGDVIESYSNGVESLSFRRTTETELRRSLSELAVSWLPDYLVARSVNFDVRKYLQSENNNSQ